MAPVKVAAVTILIAEKLKQFRREKGGPFTLILGTYMTIHNNTKQYSKPWSTQFHKKHMTEFKDTDQLQLKTIGISNTTVSSIVK